MRFQADLKSTRQSRQITFDFEYDARDLVEDEARRLADKDERVLDVRRIETEHDREIAKEAGA